MSIASELSKARREKLKQQGLCLECGKCPPETNRVRCVPCAQLSRDSNRRYRKNNPDKVKARKEQWNKDPSLRAKTNKRRKAWNQEFKYKLIRSLGGKCECCTDTVIEFLQIDHVNKDGKQHRKEIGRSVQLYRDMWKNPNRYKLRILCANCHFAITNSGTCPHQDKNHGLSKIQSDVAPTILAGSN